MVSRNGTLEGLRFLTEKSADVSARDTTNNSAFHFHAVVFTVDITKLLLGMIACKRDQH